MNQSPSIDEATVARSSSRPGIEIGKIAIHSLHLSPWGNGCALWQHVCQCLEAASVNRREKREKPGCLKHLLRRRKRISWYVARAMPEREEKRRRKYRHRTARAKAKKYEREKRPIRPSLVNHLRAKMSKQLAMRRGERKAMRQCHRIAYQHRRRGGKMGVTK